MKVKQSNIAALAALFLGVGTAVDAVPAKKPAQEAPQDRQTAEKGNQNCTNLGLDAEQIRQFMRNMPQEEQLAELTRQLAKEEAVMSSAEVRKLQNLSAQLNDKQGELEAKAQDMAAHAQELTSRLEDQLQNNRNPLLPPDEGSGWLGVDIGEVSPEKAAALKLSSVRGVIVTDVQPDSPAAKAGLKENDVLVQYDGQTVEGTVQFRRLVRETPPGRKVDVVISRDGRTVALSVELADRNAYYEKRMRGTMNDFGKPFSLSVPNVEITGPGGLLWADARAPILGIEAEDLAGQLGSYFGAPDNAGVLVREVRAGGSAQKAGIKAGDVIIKIDDKPVKSLSDLRDQLRQDRDHKTIKIGLLRKGSALTLPVEIELPKPLETIDAVHRAEL